MLHNEFDTPEKEFDATEYFIADFDIIYFPTPKKGQNRGNRKLIKHNLIDQHLESDITETSVTEKGHQPNLI